MICMLRQPMCLLSTTSRCTRLTKRTCILLLQSCKSMKHLKQIHSQMFRSCLHESKDVMDDFMVFCTNPDTGNMHYAKKVLLNLQKPSLFHYNLVIKAFAKKSCFQKVIFVYDRLREDGLLPDKFGFPFVLKAVGNFRWVWEGKKIHGLIIKIGLEFDCCVRNSLMEMYAYVGCVGTSQLLFDEMQERDVFAWNIMIAGYVKCQMFEEAISTFVKMEGEGIEPDEATLVSTLSACVPLKKLELGRNIHHHMNEKYGFTIILGNALLDMYCKCGDVDMARKLFDGMPDRNVISWTTMVSGYVNCGQLDEARVVFQKSPTKDLVLWTAMINGFVQFNQLNDAMFLFREMQANRIKPDNFTVSTLLTVCARLGALEQGRWLHGYVKENMNKIDTVVGTTLIDMYAKCGCIDECIEVFRKLEEKDLAAWNAVIYGLAMNGRTNKALALFSEMKSVGIQPDDITFIGVLSACTHSGLVNQGWQYFHDMKRNHQIQPKLEHYGCLVDLLGRAGRLNEAEKLIQSIPFENQNDILPIWGTLLSACRIHGNVSMSRRISEQFRQLESCDSGVHVLLANTYAAASRWEDVIKVRRGMKDLAVKKTPGCSSVEVDGTVYEFMAGDSSHPQASEFVFMLQNTSRTLKLEEIAENDIGNICFDHTLWDVGV